MAPIVQRISGFWGEPTSTLDWCEENYAVTTFVAEFWNTISNWMLIVPPLLGLLLTWQTTKETRFMTAFLSNVIGIGSLCFHATLLYQMQLLDELPMIYCSCVFLFCILECASDCKKYNLALIAGLIVISLLITIVYVVAKNPLIFQWAYGVLVTILTVQAYYKTKKYHCSRRMLLISLISYGVGFVLWNIENNFCSSVRYWRTNAISPLRPLTQLHAIWHLLAGIGSYYHILASLNLRLRCQGHRTGVVLVWGWLPFIITKENVINNNPTIDNNKTVTVSLYQIVWSFTKRR